MPSPSPPPGRSGPEPERVSSTSSEASTCRFCYEAEPADDLCEPCGCRGSVSTIHHACLMHWQLTIVREQGGSLAKANMCGICRQQFIPTAQLTRSELVVAAWEDR
jgi:E3 ubiquitin-protein ligase DOA10